MTELAAFSMAFFLLLGGWITRKVARIAETSYLMGFKDGQDGASFVNEVRGHER